MPFMLRGLETEGPTGLPAQDRGTCVLCGAEHLEVWLYVKALVLGVYSRDVETGEERKVYDFNMFYLRELACRECVVKDKVLTRKYGCGTMPRPEQTSPSKGEVTTYSNENPVSGT